MKELFKSLSESVSEECFDDIMGLVKEIIGEDLLTLTAKKYGEGSKQHKKADDLGDEAFTQAQNYFTTRGANHDLSTRNDLGIEKFEDNREKQVDKREAGRNNYIVKNIHSLLKSPDAAKGVIPKQVTKETSMYKPNTDLNPNNPESGLSKAKRRHAKKLIRNAVANLK